MQIAQYLWYVGHLQFAGCASHVIDSMAVLPASALVFLEQEYAGIAVQF